MFEHLSQAQQREKALAKRPSVTDNEPQIDTAIAIVMRCLGAFFASDK